MAGHQDPATFTSNERVELLADAAEAQIDSGDEVVRKGSPTTPRKAEIDESSLEEAAASTAASLGATGFMRRRRVRHIAA